MREYDGAVLFIDILGIAELTSGKTIKVTKTDFKAIGAPSSSTVSNQTFCAFLLSAFRRNLLSVSQQMVNASQLSDCAFLWSKDPNLMLCVARELMWKNLRSGILCRAGLSFGQIVEPERTNREIGHFVCGDAVTRSVDLERKGKGARVFVDTELPGLSGLEFAPSEFSDLKNASDFTEIDEFRWFTYHPIDGSLPDADGARSAVNDILELIGSLRYSPAFRWNASTAAGRLQVGCMIERLGIEIQSLDRAHSLNLGDDYYWSNPYSHGLNVSRRSNRSLKRFINEVSLK